MVLTKSVFSTRKLLKFEFEKQLCLHNKWYRNSIFGLTMGMHRSEDDGTAYTIFSISRCPLHSSLQEIVEFIKHSINFTMQKT